jgi:hypothetical protein
MAVRAAPLVSHTRLLLRQFFLYLALLTTAHTHCSRSILETHTTNTLPRSCTCPGEDHPGPSVNVGRGAPEIDILEVEHNKLGSGQVVSQSAQFAPFSHDYIYLNDTQDEWSINTPDITHANSYLGSAV